ncbi:MAG: hypothetical protein FWD23_01670 [Oscillospiraceae bacterium]|nr:hypothetical protein [Oscillospiraceae bacterium]
MAECMIFGAGKISRGFIGQLLFLSGRDFAFIEESSELTELMNARGEYTVNVFGAPEKNSVVRGWRAIWACDKQKINAEARDARVIFTAVGGKNLPAIIPALADALKSAAPGIVNVITCENWKQPAGILKNGVSFIAPEIKAGFAEAVVMRSAVEPGADMLACDPLCVCVQDYWRLPLDAGGLAAPLPEIAGVEPIHNFAGYLERKFYTYNAANGTVSYLGAALGHKYISDAARDIRIADILNKVYDETGRALCAKYGIPSEEQMAFAETSRSKLCDRIIVDTTERNARDPIRKLGPDDRLVGSAKLALNYGIIPNGLAAAVAAAIYYEGASDDSSADELRVLRENEGAQGVLRKICGLSEDDPLYDLVLKKIDELRDKKWI